MLLKIGLVLYRCFWRIFIVYCVCGCACFMCTRLKTAIWRFWDKVWLFFGEDRLATLLCSKIRSCKPGCAPVSPATHLCSTARIRRDISAASFCCCKLLWRSDECVLPPFSTRSQNFAVMNSCVAALSLFSSDILTWSADSVYSVQWHIK